LSDTTHTNDCIVVVVSDTSHTIICRRLLSA
jgi:hypothetical protein